MAPKPKKSARVKPNKTQSISLRRGTVRVEDANLLQDVCLGQSLDTIPDQIRSALYQRRVRIIGVFKHVDDDFTGRISMFEFVKGMQELGLDASPEHIGAVFHSMDDENSGSIEYGDFHNLLVRSVQSHPRLNPVEPNIVQNYGLRTDPIRKENANILSGVELGYGQEGPEGTDAETIPGLIRAALQERLVRVIDIFRQIDEDGSGSVTMREFVKSLYTMGLEAPIEAVGALFKSIDVNDRGVITYSKLHELLVRSFQTHPVLEPLDLHAMNAIGLRTKQISVADANLLQDLKLDDESLDSIPHQIRVALYKNKVRVIDIFRQMDDDASGLIDLPEFKKAMEEFGWRPHDDALNYVFSTFDCDASGSITYLELDRLLHASCETYPRLYQRRGAVVNQEEAIRQMLAQRAQRAHMQEAYASVSRPQTAASRPQTATSRPPTAMERPQTAATMPPAMRKRPTWANLGTSIKTLVAAEKSKLRPVVFTPTQITTRSGAELEAYELMNVPVEGANRGSDKLAIVTHPITGAGGASDGSKLDKLNRLALHAHLHHEGFSILAYEAHPLAVGGVQTGELQEEYLLAAMESFFQVLQDRFNGTGRRRCCRIPRNK
jgi:Ca2+-binding EF-hand superfamily protein